MGKHIRIVGLVTVCCAVMAVVEIAVEPPYAVKSMIKILVFGAVPLWALRSLGVNVFDGGVRGGGKTALRLLGLGAAIYGAIMAAYWLTRNVFDYGALVRALSADQNVRGFYAVAAYISFGNSFLEEFLFRQVAFLELSRHGGRKTAYLFSAFSFAVYHIAMIGASFPPLLTLLSLLGLAVGGVLFDWVDARDGRIWNSWIIHMFADLALMTIWSLHR